MCPPHLERLNERISIGGREIADDELDRAIEAVRQASLDARSRLLYPPTYFELVTGAAFRYFQGRTAFAVLEVGLGGRLDATKCGFAGCFCDHEYWLRSSGASGTSLAEIAAEKAGIIKKAEPVVVGSRMRLRLDQGTGKGANHRRGKAPHPDSRAGEAGISTLIWRPRLGIILTFNLDFRVVTRSKSAGRHPCRGMS